MEWTGVDWSGLECSVVVVVVGTAPKPSRFAYVDRARNPLRLPYETISERPKVGLSKNPDINQMVFPDVIVFFLLSFFQVLASHLHQAIHIVVSLWDVSLQPQALHLFFGNFCACKVAIFLGYTQNEM